MSKYTCWYDGVGEVCIGTLEAKSHAEARRFFLSRIVIRKGEEQEAIDKENFA